MLYSNTADAAREMYRAYAAADADALVEMIDDDIDWAIFGPVQIFPFQGPRRGKTAVLEALADIAKDYSLNDYRAELIITERDRAAAMCSAAFTQRATGRTLRLRLAHFLRFKEGKLIEFREFMDSFDAVEQALGAWINLPAIMGLPPR